MNGGTKMFLRINFEKLIVMTKEEELRERIGLMAREYLAKGDATGWFDVLYEEAGENINVIPWADLQPNRFLVEWDREKLSDGEGKSALIVGCGLGDEAKYMHERGYKVTAFDISEKAIAWAKRIHAGGEIEFLVADMFDPPQEWPGSFDVVIEVYTIQALPLALRAKSIAAIASFVKKGGELVVVERLRDDEIDNPDGPPWALSRNELLQFRYTGMEEVEFEVFDGDEDEPFERFVARYRQGGEMDKGSGKLKIDD